MSGPSNLEYYRERAATQRRHAESAATPTLARIHLQLAEAYEAYVAEIVNRPSLRLVRSSPQATSCDRSETFGTGAEQNRS